MKILRIFLILICPQLCIAQAGSFSVSYALLNEYAMHNFQRCSDNGYIVSLDEIYEMDEEGLCRGYLIKLDSTGATQWIKQYTKSEYSTKSSDAASVFQCADNGYIIGTCMYEMDDNQRICLIKTDASGNYQWSKLYPATGLSNAYCVIQAADGGFVLCGNTATPAGHSPYLLKTDSNGNPLLGKVIDYSFAPGEAYAIKQTTDGGYIISGEADGAFIMKTDANFNPVWDKKIGVPPGIAILFDVIQTSAGDYIASGLAGGMDNRLLLVRLDAAGNLLWVKFYRNAVSAYTYASYSVKEKSPGKFIAAPCGETSTTLMFDDSGNILWTKAQAGLGLSIIALGPGNSFAMYQNSYPTITILQSDAEGNTGCEPASATYELAPFPYTISSGPIMSNSLSALPHSLVFSNPDVEKSTNCSESGADTCSHAFFIPNVFSPNGDGDNDLFETTIGNCYKAYSMNIYNRWGELLFESTDRNKHWNGETKSGKPCPEGVYYFISTMDERKQNGFLTLLR